MPREVPSPLPPEALRPRYDASAFTFETTASFEPVEEPLGQTRASEALAFGLGMPSEGYNLFAMGPQEAGKRSLVRAFLDQRAATEPRPPDLCYVANFDDPQKPHALTLPAGRGRALRRDVAQLVEDIRTVLPGAFETDEFRARRAHIEKELRDQHEKRFDDLRAKAEARGIAVVRTPVGLVLAPLKSGEALSREDFDKLPEAEKKTLQEAMESLQESLHALLEQVPRVEKEIRDRVHALVHEVADAAVGHLVDTLVTRYQDLRDVVSYLGALRKDVLENVEEFLKPQKDAEESGPLAELVVASGLHHMRRYRVNLLVDHGEHEGAPVVYEDHPTFQNLLGRVESLAQFGALLTDHNLIRAGALHQANGGYLVLDARNLLLQPYAWEGLKRALLTHETRVESLGRMLSLSTTTSLEPEPVPLRVKVVLIGERQLHYVLSRLDPEFPTLFKVTVDFDDETKKTPEMLALYPRFLGGIAKKEDLLPLDAGAVARVMEESARLVGDAEKLSTHLGHLRDLLREATYWARERGATVTTADDVRRAVEAQVERSSRVRERIVEEIARGTLLVSTEGEQIGQVNGLSVMEYGRVAFGRPSRITAKVRLGKGEVVDIEREVELGGPIHSKGVLILAGFLGARYAQEHPLSLSATIVFEQSYGFVEGDSASCAELCTLLSALAEAPLSQSLAITGSVNQHGEVQAIGGVNEKIEGFFDVCRAKGLTGKQGVLVPASNVKHLVLRDDVIAAVRDGTFRVIPIATVDQAMELLTGVACSDREPSGEFEPGSINARVEARLVALAKRRVELVKEEGRGAPR